MTSRRPAALFAGGARGVELYTRVTLYLFVPLEGFFYLYAVAALASSDEPLPSPPWLIALLVAAVVHVGLCLATVHIGFDRSLVVRGRLRPVVLAMLVMTAVVVALAFLLPGAGAGATPGDGPVLDGRGLTIAVCGAGTFAALAVQFPFRPLAVMALVVPVLVLGAAALDRSTEGSTVRLALITYAMVVFWLGTVRLSMWVLEVVRELEASRDIAGRLAVAEERLRISRDIHDVVGRALSAVAVKSELSAALARRGDPRAADEMDEVRTLAQESLREVRGVVAGYRAPDLSTEFAGARSVLRAAGIAARVVGEVPSIPAADQEVLAWVVRESVTNVVRHSRASECRLYLDVEDGATVLRVTNDGVDAETGPGSSGPGSEGSGLTGLRERLAAVGGTLDVTADGDRFTVVARIPARIPTRDGATS